MNLFKPGIELQLACDIKVLSRFIKDDRISHQAAGQQHALPFTAGNAGGGRAVW